MHEHSSSFVGANDVVNDKSNLLSSIADCQAVDVYAKFDCSCRVVNTRSSETHRFAPTKHTSHGISPAKRT